MQSCKTDISLLAFLPVHQQCYADIRDDENDKK